MELQRQSFCKEQNPQFIEIKEHKKRNLCSRISIHKNPQNQMKSVSFTFKTKNKFDTPLRGKLYKIHTIMLRRKEVGFITDFYPYMIYFNIAKAKSIKGDINQCTCDTISLGGTFNSIDSAKAWLLMNVKTILQQYVLVDIQKTNTKNKTNDNTH